MAACDGIRAVSRQRPQVTLTAAVFAALGAPSDADDALTEHVLDATEGLLRSLGLRRWSIEDVADRAGVGRTSVYRRFGNRDELVHAVLARELRQTFASIARAASAATTLEDKAVAAVRAALEALNGSVVDGLLRTDAQTFVPFLTTDAGPLLRIARETIAAQVAAAGGQPADELAEAAARIGLSFVLTRDTVLPLDDPAALDAAVRRMVVPLLAALGVG